MKSMKVAKENLLPARVLHEDDDHITLEVAKHDAAKFTLQQDPETGEVVGGDQFYTIMFIRFEDGVGEFWKPWEAT